MDSDLYDSEYTLPEQEYHRQRELRRDDPRREPPLDEYEMEDDPC